MGSISAAHPPLWRLILVVAGGVIIHITFGTSYTYGNFAPYFVSYMRDRKVAPDLQYHESVWMFAMLLLGQGITGFIGGMLERLIGPRLTTLTGSWIMSSGVLLTYFTVSHSFLSCLITYGFMFGCGGGLAYPIPMGCAMRWMPRRKGFAAGFVVAGYGGGAFIFNQVITSFVNPRNLSPDIDYKGEQYFSQAEVLDRVPYCFLILGATFAVMQLIGTLMISDPPTFTTLSQNQEENIKATPEIEGGMENGNNEIEMETAGGSTEAPANTETPIPAEDKASESKESESKESRYKYSVMRVRGGIKPLEMMKTQTFYFLWFLFLTEGQSMVFIATLYKAFGQTFIQDDQFLSLVGAFSSLCNASGRILWGVIADRTSFRTAQLAITVSLTFLYTTFIVTEYAGKTLFFIWVCLIFLTFSGSFSTFPSCTMRCFGEQYYSTNYGLLFTSQAMTAIIGSILSQFLLPSIGWMGLFFVAAGISACAVAIAYHFKEPTL